MTMNKRQKARAILDVLSIPAGEPLDIAVATTVMKWERLQYWFMSPGGVVVFRDHKGLCRSICYGLSMSTFQPSAYGIHSREAAEAVKLTYDEVRSIEHLLAIDESSYARSSRACLLKALNLFPDIDRHATTPVQASL